jgi:hypothetical protein
MSGEYEKTSHSERSMTSLRTRKSVGWVLAMVSCSGLLGLKELTGDDDVGIEDGKKSLLLGGKDEYERADNSPPELDRSCKLTRVSESEFRTAVPSFSLQKWSGLTSEKSWSGNATFSVAIRRYNIRRESGLLSGPNGLTMSASGSA